VGEDGPSAPDESTKSEQAMQQATASWSWFSIGVVQWSCGELSMQPHEEEEGKGGGGEGGAQVYDLLDARVYDLLDVVLDVLWILCMCVNFDLSPQDG
jgi:hypothetical protein